MTTTDSIIELARLYAAERGIALTTVGRLAMGHGHFFARLKAGRVTIRKAEGAMQWLADNWPADVEWPAHIARPNGRRNSGSEER